MPVIRTFITKIKPGRMQDAMAQVPTYNRIFLETGATHFAAYNLLTGPNFPGMMLHAIYENFAAFGDAREKLLAHPEGPATAFAADAPQEVARALIEEPVYRAGGDDAGGWLADTKVRFAFTLQPSKGRGADVVRRSSRLADQAVECGALCANVRRIVAGSDSPMLVFASYHEGFGEFEATRNGVLESDLWTALNSSQDPAMNRGASLLATKIPT